MKIFFTHFFILLCSLHAQGQLLNLYTCKAIPAYITQTNIDAKNYLVSTSDRFRKGLLLINNDSAYIKNGKATFYQHPTWNKYGNLGSFTMNEKGEIFVIPVPIINVLENPKQAQNTILKTDNKTGELKPYIILPSSKNKIEGNPFGLMGLYYDCSSKILYATSVYYSNSNNENGTIYAIDTKQSVPVIIDSITHIDAFGICVAKIRSSKILMFGSARKSTITGIVMDTNGKFTNKKRQAINLENIGPRGDDKCRKIKVTDKGELIIYGVEFNWNLTAPTEKQETEYTYIWDARTSNFVLINIANPYTTIGY